MASSVLSPTRGVAAFEQLAGSHVLGAPVVPSRAARVFTASWRLLWLNYVSAAALLLLGYGLVTTHAFYQWLFAPVTFAFLKYALGAYLILLPFYFATLPDSHEAKCRLFWRALFQLRRRRPLPREQVALRAVLVKAFYLPLMCNWTLLHLQGVEHYVQGFRE